jgi:3-oxoacyl-(acyl-carrier-protein) synthase
MTIAITGVGAVGPAEAVSLEALAPALRSRAARAEQLAQLALCAVGRALDDASLTVSDGPAREGIGIVLGTAFGCFLTNAAFQRRLADGGVTAASPRLFAATVANAAAGEASIAYRLGGPAVTLTAGAASGLVAVGHAGDLLRCGHATVIVAGGVDALGAPLEGWLRETYGRAPSGDDGSGAAAILVLEPEPLARRRGARVVATVVGAGYGYAEPMVGDEEGVGGAVEQALAEARLEPAALGQRVFIAGVSAPGLGAAGPLALLRALDELPPGAAALVAQRCESGHAAALVVRRAAA